MTMTQTVHVDLLGTRDGVLVRPLRVDLTVRDPGGRDPWVVRSVSGKTPDTNPRLCSKGFWGLMLLL